MSRQLNNPFKATDWSDTINEFENQFGVMNAKGLFEAKGVASETITFEKNYRNNTLVESTNRRAGKPSTGIDRKTEYYTLTIPYFLQEDNVTVQDIQGYTKSGMDGRKKLLGEAVADKLEDLKVNADQTFEHMKIEAIKGLTQDAYGNVIADMFSEFGISSATRNAELSNGGYSLDFELGTSTTNVREKIKELKRFIGKKALSGTAVGKIEIPCSEEFFDALVNHESVLEAYDDYANSDVNGEFRRSKSLSTMMQWGVMDVFEYQDVLFYTYPAVFAKDDGNGGTTTVRAFGEAGNHKEGYTIVNGVKGAYRGAYAPANTLEGANVLGDPMYVRQFADPRGRSLDFEVEYAPLFWIAKPQLSIRCHSSN